LSLIKNIFKNQLFKVSSLNGLSVVTRLIGGLLASKMTAVFLGPAGLAFTGSFRNFLTSLDAFSMLGMQNGIIKYTAQHEKEQQKLYEALATAFVAVICAVVVFALVLVVPASFWSTRVFNGSTDFTWLFILTGLSLPLYAGSLLFMSVLNGYSRYKNVIWITIISYAVGVLLSATLIYYNGLAGALIALLTTPALMCSFSFYALYKHTRFAFLHLKYFRFSALKGLLSFSLMSSVMAILGPLIYITLRNMLITHSGGDVAGYWEGINRLSSFYMMFISTLLGVYFLPKLSQATTDADTKTIVRGYYTFVVPLFGLGLLVIYLLRRFIIALVLSKGFMPMEKLFAWQLLGDLLKVCSLILGQEFFARKMTRAFIITEVCSFAVLYLSGSYLISLYGAEGAVMAHAFTYLVYLIVLGVYFRKRIF
jgi:O-antigen/teichoic acid export membrane protein